MESAGPGTQMGGEAGGEQPGSATSGPHPNQVASLTRPLVSFCTTREDEGQRWPEAWAPHESRQAPGLSLSRFTLSPQNRLSKYLRNSGNISKLFLTERMGALVYRVRKRGGCRSNVTMTEERSAG